MSDLHDAGNRDRWEAWVREACAALGVESSLVDIDAIHALTKEVAHRFERPLAPVSSFILGLAIAGGGDPEALRSRLEATLPPA